MAWQIEGAGRSPVRSEPEGRGSTTRKEGREEVREQTLQNPLDYFKECNLFPLKPIENIWRVETGRDQMHISKRVLRLLCAGRVEGVRVDCSRSAPRLLFAIQATSADLLGSGVRG